MQHHDVVTGRNEYIGGSDISALMGLSRWKTPYKLWAEKTGKIEIPDLSNVEAVEMGNELEETVARVFTKRTQKQVRRSPKRYVHKEYPFMQANIDRLITGSDEILECKTCSIYKLEEWENKIPQEYILQVMWYLGLTGKKIGWVAVLVGGQKFLYKRIDFDEELFQTMIERATAFWELVKTNTPPVLMPQDDDVLGEIYPEHTEDLIEAQYTEERASYLLELKMHKKEIETEIKEIETEIKNAIGDKLGLLTDKYKITWKKQVTRRLDTDRLKQEQSEIAQKYIKETATRVLRITNNKKGVK